MHRKNLHYSSPLSVNRCGVTKDGTSVATISPNTDTVASFLKAGRFPGASDLLPADKYTLANAVSIADGQGTGDLSLVVDLNFLLNNVAKKYAFVVGVSAFDKPTANASTAIVLIHSAFLVPAAGFTTTVSTGTVSFSNTSLNGVTYSWNYGEGTPLFTDKASPHTYANAGTYTITLTVTDALGDFNKAVYSADVVIP